MTRPLVYIPINKDITIEQAEKLASEVDSFLVDGYSCKIERDKSVPFSIIICSEKKK